jgi:tRNA nucleotidyltransferase/poly(A) polymerase
MDSNFNLFVENALDHYGVKNPMIDAAFEVLKKIKGQLGEEALIVGGSVRDIIMGKEPHDVDITSSASPEQIGTIFKTHDIGKSKDFGIVVVRQDGYDFEVAQFRKDGEYTDSRRPDSVEVVKDFKDDASRRDFSINALGINSKGEIVDHFGGIDDIKNQMIKAVGNPRKRFTEDALRIIRMVRFAAKTGFSIEPETFQAAKELAPLIAKLSAERIRDEMYKAAGSGTSLAKFVQGLDSIGLLETILPEVYQMKDLKHNPKHHPEGDSLVLGHVLEALKASRSSNPLTNIAILFHDLGKTTTLGYKNDQPTYYGHEAAGIPVFQKLAARLKISNADKEAIEFAIGNHMHGHKLGELNDKMVLRLRQNPNWELLKDVIYSDEASRGDVFKPEEHENKMKRADDVMQKFGDKEAFEKRMSALINGEVIMATIPNINGKEIGRIKNLVRDWIIQQQFNVTPEQVKEKILELSTVKENKETTDREGVYHGYHGTDNLFDIFEDSKIGSRTDPGFFGQGHYFLDDPLTASRWGKYVIEADISLRNPLIVSGISEFVQKSGQSKTNTKEEYLKEMIMVTNKLKESGYDGVVINKSDGRQQYVAFYSTSINNVKKIQEMKENKFNKLTKALLEHLVKEDNSAGGAMGVFGDTAAASPHIGGSSYAISYAGNDTRLPKPLGKGVMRRNPVELTVFATGVSRKKGKSKKSGKQKQTKR